MKIYKILVFILFATYSCTNSDNDIPKEIEINTIDVDLSIDIKKVKGVYFKTKNLETFTTKFSKDFFGDNSFYFSIGDNVTTVSFSDLIINEDKDDVAYSSKSKVTCSTCRSEKCVQDKIKEAFAKNDPKEGTVYIATKPVKTLGVTTGVKVCYSKNPIDVSTLYIEPPELTDDDLGDREDIIDIDDILEPK